MIAAYAAATTRRARTIAAYRMAITRHVQTIVAYQMATTRLVLIVRVFRMGRRHWMNAEFATAQVRFMTAAAVTSQRGNAIATEIS